MEIVTASNGKAVLRFGADLAPNVQAMTVSMTKVITVDMSRRYHAAMDRCVVLGLGRVKDAC